MPVELRSSHGPPPVSAKGHNASTDEETSHHEQSDDDPESGEFNLFCQTASSDDDLSIDSRPFETSALTSDYERRLANARIYPDDEE